MTVFLPNSPDAKLQAKLQHCGEVLRGLGKVVVAFPAGADSTLLLALAVDALGTDEVLAAMAVSPSLAQRERRHGRDLARRIGAELVEVNTGEMSDPEYTANSTRRCYYCRRHLYRRLWELARRRGIPSVVCGTNADDAGDYRPGLQAGMEMGVRSPLLEAGLGKEEIRSASLAMNLSTWQKPASPCLASRISYGERITAGRLSRIERGEDILKDLGFQQCRVGDHGVLARIEVLAAEAPRAVEFRDVLLRQLRDLGYTYVTLDLAGFRSGSMNAVLESLRGNSDEQVSLPQNARGRV
jgi:uncharacterized protein